jgi:hypothetical protein
MRNLLRLKSVQYFSFFQATTARGFKEVLNVALEVRLRNE